MANFYYDGAGGTSGSPVTTAEGFQSVSAGVTYSDQHAEEGTLAFVAPPSSAGSNVQVPNLTPTDVIEMTGYFYLTAPVTTDIYFFQGSTSAGSTALNIGINGSGHLNLITPLATPQIPYQSTGLMPINTLFRWGVYANLTTNEVRSAVYLGDSQRALLDSGIRTATGIGSDIRGFRFLRTGSAAYAGTVYGSAIRVKTGADATGTFAPEHAEIAPRVLTTFAPVFDHESFRAGVILGEATTTLRLAVSVNPDLSNPVYFAAAINSTDWYGTAKATGLEDDTKYFYYWEVDGDIRPEVFGAVYTVRAPGSPTSFQFGTASCQATGSNHPSLEHVANSDYRFFCHQGDLHYADATTRSAMKAGFESSLLTERMKKLTQSTGMQYCWDNHDRIIVGPLNTGATSIATLDFWREFTADDMPADANYKTWVDGRVRFIHTDPWTQRQDESTSEPRTMFGATQIAWIKDTLESATEPVIVWLKSFPNHFTANGRWDSFPTEIAMWDSWIAARPGIRDRLVMIGGDSHDIRADSGTRTADVNGGPQHFQGVPDLNVSGLNQGNDVVDWDTTGYDLGVFATGVTSGAYSRCTVTDDGGATILLKWEAVRISADGVVDIPTSHTFGFAAESLETSDITLHVLDEDGVEQEAKLTVWNGVEEVAPMSLGVMPLGYDSTSVMTFQRPWMVAHRGGSANWPECSLKAYTQSVAWGVPALELSLNMTSDGVFFGLHDQYLDRTSTNATGSVNPQALTWAQLQATYKLDQAGVHVPYMRAEEALELYSDSHVFFIDPKYIGAAGRVQMYAMLKTFPGWEKMVIKSSGGGIYIATEARAQGFKSWGYWYDTPTDLTSLANANSYWDYLGMDYTGSQAAWDQVVSYGKPVVAHILPSLSSYTTALTKGANATSLGLMVSGVKNIVGTPKVFDNIVPPALEGPDALAPGVLLAPSESLVTQG